MNNQQSETLLSDKAIDELKVYLDQGFRIRMYDLVMKEARVLFDGLTAKFPDISNTNLCSEELAMRLNHYNNITNLVQNLIIVGCFWGQKDYDKAWVKCLELIANLPREPGFDPWVRLKLYPALLLLYSGGIAAIAGE
jgi:hypothetical protein